MDQQLQHHLVEFAKDSTGPLKDWIPVIEKIIWPVALLIILFAFRRHVLTVLSYIEQRVRAGDPFEIAGVKIGVKMSASTRPEELKAEGKDPRVPPELPNTIYMSHRSVRDPSLDRRGNAYYRVTIFLDADTTELLDQVERVMYHLHPTFKNPDRESTDRDSRFELRTIAWGEFNMTADIYFKGKKEPLTVERYINLQ